MNGQFQTGLPILGIKETRRQSIDNYLVFYIPDKDTEIVTVIRVVYSGRDVDAQLMD